MYSTHPTLIFDFEENGFDKDTIIANVDRAQLIGKSTATGAALNLVRTQLLLAGRRGYRGVDTAVVVITDGHTLEEQSVLLDAVQQLHSTGASVYALGVGSEVNKPELHLIASGSEKVLLVKSFNELSGEQFARTTLEALACDMCTFRDIDLAFILDASGSISDTSFNSVKGFAASIVSNLFVGENASR
jgi:hypothetical protein